MLTVSRPDSSALNQIARSTLAIVVALVLLAGVVPLSALSSSSQHQCEMACCAGKPTHMEGSCNAALDAEEPDEAGDESSAGEEAEATMAAESPHHHNAHSSIALSSSGARSEPDGSGKHRGGTRRSSAHDSTPSREAARKAGTAAGAVSRPCSPECAAAASASSQIRRPRDPSSPAPASRPVAPALKLLFELRPSTLPDSAQRRRLSRPRAPPFHLTNLSA